MFNDRAVFFHPSGSVWNFESVGADGFSIYPAWDWQNKATKYRSNGDVSFSRNLGVTGAVVIGVIQSAQPQYAFNNVKLAVEGAIGARNAVYVRTPGAAWPDYVFEPTYALRPLPEVAEYIARNGHLPDVPTAAEVECDGIELASMNAVLLRKVEELTLHLIALQKQNEALQGRMEQVEDKIK